MENEKEQTSSNAGKNTTNTVIPIMYPTLNATESASSTEGSEHAKQQEEVTELEAKDSSVDNLNQAAAELEPVLEAAVTPTGENTSGTEGSQRPKQQVKTALELNASVVEELLASAKSQTEELLASTESLHNLNISLSCLKADLQDYVEKAIATPNTDQGGRDSVISDTQPAETVISIKNDSVYESGDYSNSAEGAADDDIQAAGNSMPYVGDSV
jgi:hypothetical protein